MTSILIVDDSAAMRQHLRACLEEAADPGDTPQIAEATSGLEALRLLPHDRPAPRAALRRRRRLS